MTPILLPFFSLRARYRAVQEPLENRKKKDRFTLLSLSPPLPLLLPACSAATVTRVTNSPPRSEGTREAA
jgi:hypothetical protein